MSPVHYAIDFKLPDILKLLSKIFGRDILLEKDDKLNPPLIRCIYKDSWLCFSFIMQNLEPKCLSFCRTFTENKNLNEVAKECNRLEIVDRVISDPHCLKTEPLSLHKTLVVTDERMLKHLPFENYSKCGKRVE